MEPSKFCTSIPFLIPTDELIKFIDDNLKKELSKHEDKNIATDILVHRYAMQGMQQ